MGAFSPATEQYYRSARDRADAPMELGVYAFLSLGFGRCHRGDFGDLG
jgi:hypothetical protein